MLIFLDYVSANTNIAVAMLGKEESTEQGSMVLARLSKHMQHCLS